MQAPLHSFSVSWGNAHTNASYMTKHLSRWTGFTDLFYPQNSGWDFTWSVSALLCLRSAALPCVSCLPSAIRVLYATQMQADLILFPCRSHSSASQVSLSSSCFSSLSPPISAALLARLPKIMFPTEHGLCAVWRRVPFCLLVTAQPKSHCHLYFYFSIALHASVWFAAHLGSFNMIAS